MKWGCCMISNYQKYLEILLTFICVIVLYPQSPYATEAISQRETIRVGFFEMDGYLCRMKPENEAAMDMIPYVLWHATGMFILNTSATTKLGLIACTDLREDNPFSFDLNFFHDYSILHYTAFQITLNQLHHSFILFIPAK